MNFKYNTPVLNRLYSKPSLFSQYRKDYRTIISGDFNPELDRITPNNNTITVLMFSNYGKTAFFNFYRHHTSLLNKCYRDHKSFDTIDQLIKKCKLKSDILNMIKSHVGKNIKPLKNTKLIGTIQPKYKFGNKEKQPLSNYTNFKNNKSNKRFFNKR